MSDTVYTKAAVDDQITALTNQVNALGSGSGSSSSTTAEYATLINLRAETVSSALVTLLGYYAAGDGGGGMFYWDSTDTTSTDNGGTIIVPSSTLSSSGRWKRVIAQGSEVNARWFGVNTSQGDNTQALQNAVSYMAVNNQTGSSATVGGTLYIPFGYYKFLFTEGTSGLSTITQTGNYLTIRGDGMGTNLHYQGTTTQIPSFFTITKAAGRGQGGGIRDLMVTGNSLLQWVVTLDCWRFWGLERVKVQDVLSGLLDACNNQQGASVEGEHIWVKDVDHTSSSGTNSCFPQYGVRFRPGSYTSTIGAWSDILVENAMFLNVWDTGIVFDSITRSFVKNSMAGTNTSSSNTIDGTTKTGVRHVVSILNGSSGRDTGRHVIDGIYQESHTGSETPGLYSAVFIDASNGSAGSGAFNKLNRIQNIAVSTTATPSTGNFPALLNIQNSGGLAGKVSDTYFSGNRRDYLDGQIIVGANVTRTMLNLYGNTAQTALIKDSGTYTSVNGQWERSLSGAAPATQPITGDAEPGQVIRDLSTGRMWMMDRDNVPAMIRHQPGVDTVSTVGAQRITSMSTPAAPSLYVAPTAGGSTTWNYYVVAVDKDGNRTPASTAGTTISGPATLSATANIAVSWQPVTGAATYDLLRGDNSHSVATGLTRPYYKDIGGATSAYTPGSVAPYGDLTVDGRVYAGPGTSTPPTLTAAAGMGTSPGTVVATGDDMAGSISLTTGTTPTTGAGFTVTFSRPFARTPKAVILSRQDNSSITLAMTALISSVTTTGFTVNFGTAPAASTNYKLWYHVVA